MTYKIVFAKKAYDDLANVYNEVLIASKDHTIADKYVSDILLAIKSKSDYPNSTQKVGLDLPKEVRFFTFKAYKVFYYVEGNKIIIISILLAKSDYSKKILVEFR